MNIRDWESRRTLQAWGTGSGSPAFMILSCLAVNLVALIVVIIINLTVSSDGYNDYAAGFAWAFMTPIPVIGILWALIDVALCHYSVLHPVYYLAESTILAILSAIFGAMSIVFWSWDSDGSWIPGIFILLACVVYFAIMTVCARLIHKQKTRPQSSGVA